MKQEVKPAEGKLGIMVVGCGAVATTFMTGVLMVRKGLSKPVGSMTQYDKIRVGRGAEKKYLHYGDIVPLAKLDDIVFGTWDAYPQNAYQAAVYAEVLKAKDIEPVRDELEKIVPMKAAFDPNDPNNIAEIGKMREQIEQISADKDATLQSLTINGTSSPDGRYNSNLQLAKKRMDYAVNYLRGLVPERARRGMKFASNAAVAPWGKVADLLRADSLYDEARQVENITKRWGNIDDQSRGMRKLPFYRSLLMDKYLPRLRHVGYVMNYSVFRQLTLDEIRQLYAADYKQLTKYEYFRLYRAEADSVRRETMLRQALEIYPSFMVAANDLSALLINRQAADADLLRPFAGKNAPAVVNTNQMTALLNAGLYTAADSLSAFVPDNETTHMLLAEIGRASW